MAVVLAAVDMYIWLILMKEKDRLPIEIMVWHE